MTAPEGHGLAYYKFTEVSLVRFALNATEYIQNVKEFVPLTSKNANPNVR